MKLRGFRIELGEIETVLAQHPGVREAIAVAREDSPGEKRLIAYAVAREEPPPTTSAMRAYLKEKLPEYMVPSSFVVLDALPLTATGKVDRNRLPAPEQVRPELAQVYIGPRTPVEEVLCGVFSEVLQIEPVGVHDSFFDLGGHSLLATQVVSRLRMDFQIELPLRTLFEARTVELLAKVMLEGSQERERVEHTAELLLKLSTLSDEEAEKLIAKPQSQPQITQKNKSVKSVAGFATEPE